MKIGNLVRINPESEFAIEDDDWNPVGVVGTISEYIGDICFDLPLIVVWDNGVDTYGDARTNSYNEKDLILVA